MLLFLVAGFAHALMLEAVDDSFGVPFGKPLQIEAFGVLENDILDGQSAGENGATAELLSGVSSGTLSCPTDTTVVLCADGSFEYTPGINFSGTDSFTYQAVFNGVISAPATVNLTACAGGPDIFSCWQESSYLAMLAELGYGTFVEGFEGAAWDSVRSTFDTIISAPSIISQGITWTTNHPGTNEITTGTGPARTGEWGGYDPNHGHATGSFAECDVDTPPASCLFHDGLSGKILTGGDALHGVGGYITGFNGASIAIILDGTTQIAIGKLPDSGHHFFGLIDARPAGFTGFEFRELDGKVGQEKFIFGDDFIIGASGVVSVNNPPVLDSIGNQEVNEGALLSILLTASDADGDSLSFSMGGAPTGATLVDNGDGTATFEWTPDFGQAGNYGPVTFTVTDDGVPAASDSEAITITVGDVNRPPVLSPVGNQAVSEGVLLSILLTASDPDGDGWSFSMSGAPTGATLVDNGDGTATFSWTPDFGQAGNYPVTFTVTDDGVPAASDSEAITITVGDVNRPPVLSPVGNQAVSEGVLLSILLTASDPDGDGWSFSMSGAPTDSSLVDNGDGTATFSWTPDFGQAGNYPVTFTVTDDGVPAASDSEAITITVGDVNRPPVLSPVGNQAVSEGVLLSILLTASDPDGDGWSFSMSAAPTGATLVDNGDGTATFSWTPDFGQAGNYPVTFTVTDDGVPAASDSEAITITVGDVNRPPVLTPIGDQPVNEGELLSLLLTASDPDGDSWSFSMSAAPTGATLVDNGDGTATFSWTPDFGQAGNYPVTFTVTDDGVPAASDSESITISVSANTTNSAPIANAGTDQVVVAGKPVTLDGGGSTDADGDAMSYSWSLISQPAGSTVTLSDPTVVKPIFVADVVGAYEVKLIVNDGLLDSLPDTVTITTSDTGTVTVTNGLPVVLLQYILDHGR